MENLEMTGLKQCPETNTLTEGEGSVQLTSMYSLFYSSCFLYWKYHLHFHKTTTLKRRSTVLSLPLKLVFPVSSFVCPTIWNENKMFCNPGTWSNRVVGLRASPVFTVNGYTWKNLILPIDRRNFVKWIQYRHFCTH